MLHLEDLSGLTLLMRRCRCRRFSVSCDGDECSNVYCLVDEFNSQILVFKWCDSVLVRFICVWFLTTICYKDFSIIVLVIVRTQDIRRADVPAVAHARTVPYETACRSGF